MSSSGWMNLVLTSISFHTASLKGGYFFCCCLITVISLSFIHPYSLFIHKLHKYICAILPLPWRRYIHHKKREENLFYLPHSFQFLKVKISLCVLHTGQCCTVPGMLLPRDENECVFFPKTFFFAIKNKNFAYIVSTSSFMVVSFPVKKKILLSLTVPLFDLTFFFLAGLCYVCLTPPRQRPPNISVCGHLLYFSP